MKNYWVFYEKCLSVIKLLIIHVSKQVITCLTDSSCFTTYKMESYCLKCKQNTRNIDPKTSNTSNGRAMALSKCAICGSKKSRFIKNQEAKGLLSNLGIKSPLSKIAKLGDILL